MLNRHRQEKANDIAAPLLALDEFDHLDTFTLIGALLETCDSSTDQQKGVWQVAGRKFCKRHKNKILGFKRSNIASQRTTAQKMSAPHKSPKNKS